MAVRSAISDFDKPFVTTVGTLTAADVVGCPDAVAFVVAATGVLRVAEDRGVDTGADRVVDAEVEAVAVTPVGAVTRVVGLTALVVPGDGATADPVDEGAELTAAVVGAELTADGAAVNVVGPAAVDVHELSTRAATDQPTSTPLRRLFTIRPPPLSSRREYRLFQGSTSFVHKSRLVVGALNGICRTGR